jgi:hypothetical protein
MPAAAPYPVGSGSAAIRRTMSFFMPAENDACTTPLPPGVGQPIVPNFVPTPCLDHVLRRDTGSLITLAQPA